MPTPHHLVAPPVIIAATPVRPLAAPQPALAPSLPPVCTVDLMTLEGSAILGAQWKTLVPYPDGSSAGLAETRSRRELAGAPVL